MAMGILSFFSGAGPKYRPKGPAVTPEGRRILNVPPDALVSGKEAALGRKQFDVTVRVLDLSVAEHLEEYQNILDRIANKSWMLLGRKEQWSQELNTWKVLVSYADVGVVIPEWAARRARGGA